MAEDSEDKFNPSLEEPKHRKHRKATTPATLDSDEMEDSASDGGMFQEDLLGQQRLHNPSLYNFSLDSPTNAFLREYAYPTEMSIN